MTDDETTTPEPTNADTEPDAAAPAASDGGGVVIPSWLAGALVVVLALVIAGAGFAIGRATAPDDDGFRPIVATDGGCRGEGSRTSPIPGRGPGGGPGGPGGLPGPGGPQGRGGDEHRRRLPGFPDERPDGSDSGDSGDDSRTPAPPDLPGT
jgi:hypothetical protein